MDPAVLVLSTAALRARIAAFLVLPLFALLGGCGDSSVTQQAEPEQRLFAAGSAWYAITPPREVLQVRFNALPAMAAGLADAGKVLAVTSWSGDTIVALSGDGTVHVSGDSGFAGTATCRLWWDGHAPRGECPAVSGLQVASNVRDITDTQDGWMAVTREGRTLGFSMNAAPTTADGFTGIARIIAVHGTVLGLGDDGNVYAFGSGMYAGTAACTESATTGVSCPDAQRALVAQGIRALTAFPDGWLAVANDGSVLKTVFNTRPVPVAGLQGIRKAFAVQTPSRVDHWDTPLGGYTIVALGRDGKVYASGSAANAGTGSCVDSDGSMTCPLVAGEMVAAGVRDIAPLGRPLYPRGWLAVMDDATVRQAETNAQPTPVGGLTQIEEVIAIGGEATGSGEPVYTTIVGRRADGSLYASGSAAYAGTASCTPPATPQGWPMCPVVSGVKVY